MTITRTGIVVVIAAYVVVLVIALASVRTDKELIIRIAPNKLSIAVTNNKSSMFFSLASVKSSPSIPTLSIG